MQATPRFAPSAQSTPRSGPSGSNRSGANTPRFDQDVMAEALRQSIASHKSTPVSTPRQAESESAAANEVPFNLSANFHKHYTMIAFNLVVWSCARLVIITTGYMPYHLPSRFAINSFHLSFLHLEPVSMLSIQNSEISSPTLQRAQLRQALVASLGLQLGSKPGSGGSSLASKDNLAGSGGSTPRLSHRASDAEDRALLSSHRGAQQNPGLHR